MARRGPVVPDETKKFAAPVLCNFAVRGETTYRAALNERA